MDRIWWKEKVVYEVYIRSFKDSDGDGTGDLRGVLERLGYIGSLGAEVIWLTPIFPSPWRDSGYDVSDYDQIHPQLGTMADLDSLIKDVHARGMKIVLDVVLNHTSDEHAWFKESRSSRNNPKRDYYIWRPPREGAEPNNWRSLVSGSAWEWDDSTGQYFLHLFSKHQPDLNWRNPEVKEAMFSSLRQWLDRGVDGFRMDIINCLMKPEGLPDAPRQPGDADRYVLLRSLYADNAGMHEVLQEMHRRVFHGHDIVTIGEVHFNTKEKAQLFVDPHRRELNLIFQPDILFDRTGMDYIRKSIGDWHAVMHARGWNGFALGNHDTPRQVSILGDERRYWAGSAKLLATLALTVPGTPFLYQGDELGMTNVLFQSLDEYRDIEMKSFYQERLDAGMSPSEALNLLRPGSRDNSRTPMQWDSSPNAGFSTGTPWIGVNPNYTRINVAAQENDPESVLNYTRKLIAFRKGHPALIYGDYQVILEDHPQVYAYWRTLPDERILVLLNFFSRSVRLQKRMIKSAVIPDLDHLIFSTRTPTIALDWSLAPWEARILKA
jgi:oligo-1,6-glucosidase